MHQKNAMEGIRSVRLSAGRKKQFFAVVLFSMLLTFALAICTQAASAQAAIGKKNYATLKEALNSVQSGQTIKLKKNISISTKNDGFIVNRNVKFTLDFAGKTIKGVGGIGNTVDPNKETYKGVIHVERGNVTIKKGKISGSGSGNAITVAKGASVTIHSGTFTRQITNWGNLTIKNGKFTCNDRPPLVNCIGGKLTINNATVTSKSNCISIKGGTVEIKKAMITGKGKTYPAIYIDNGANLTIGNAKVKTASKCLYIIGGSSVLIKKGTYSSTDNNAVYISNDDDRDDKYNRTKLTVAGGTIKAKNYWAIYNVGGAVNIKGGKVYSEKSNAIGVRGVWSGALTITGGKVYVGSKSKYSPVYFPYYYRCNTINLNCVKANKKSTAKVDDYYREYYSKADYEYFKNNIKKIEYGVE